MELHLKKNAAAEIMFPMVDATTPSQLDTGETVTDTGYYKDGAGSWTSLSITDTVTEISTTGMYTIELTAGEMNHDLIMLKFTSTNAADTVVIIRTFAVDVDDLVRSTTPANTLDVSATGEAGIDWGNVGSPSTAQNLSSTTVNLVNTVTTLTGHTAQTGDSFAIVNNGTYGNAQLVRSTTPANTLDVSATGEAGVDWANVGSQATAVTLSNTSISSVSGSVGSVTGAVGSVTGNVGGNVTGSVGSVVADVDINMAQTTPGSPTADTTGEALRKAHQQLPEAPLINTAFNDLTFLMVDETDFATPETGLTVSGTVSKNGGAFGSITGSIAEIANGIYQADLSAADMNGAMLIFRFTATGAADTFVTIKTAPAI